MCDHSEFIHIEKVIASLKEERYDVNKKEILK